MARNGLAGISLLDRLITLQEAHGWSDREFARKLGISNGLWSATRNRRKPLGRKALQGVLRAFPELEAEVKAHWAGVLSSPDIPPMP